MASVSVNTLDSINQFIVLNCKTLTAIEMAKRLGVSVQSVKGRAKRLKAKGFDAGLKKFGNSHPKAIHSEEDVELCRSLKEVGLSARSISEKMEIPYNTVRKIIYFNCRFNG